MSPTPLRRDADPLMLLAYLRERVVDLHDIAVVHREDLLPARAVACDGSLRPRPIGASFEMGVGVLLDHPFTLIEAEVSLSAVPETCPAVHFRCGRHSESMLLIDGDPVTGIGTAMWDDGQPVWVPRLAGGSRKIQLHVERDEGAGAMRLAEASRLERLDVLSIHEPTFDLAVAIDTASAVYRALDEANPCRGAIRRALLDAARQLAVHDPATVRSSASTLRQALVDRVFNGEHVPPKRLLACGHAHIDLAWLWPRTKTRRKSARTFAAQLALSDRFPWAKFQQGQVPLYDWIRQDAPELSERVRAKLSDGTFVADGTVYVEPDTHATGLESLIRQLTHGRRRFAELVPTPSRVVWMPDCFGFSRALPQLMSKAGIEVLITSKISWNDHTRFPYDTFRWFGADGSSVLVHFLTTPGSNRRIHTYNTEAAVDEIDQTWRHYQQKEANQTLLMPYGYGDGGGGPREAMLRRLDLLRRGATGFMRVEPGTPSDFIDELIDRVDVDDLPTWHDELYLEHHRGTYSSQAAIKTLNATNERLLLAAEARDAIGLKRVDRSAQWETLLFAQFHDILPGTSIEPANRDEAERLEKLRLELLAEASGQGPSVELVWFNANGWAFEGRAFDGDEEYVIDRMAPFAVGGASSSPLRWGVSSDTLRNDRWVVQIDESTGALASIVDRASGRDWLADRGFELALFEDRPHVRGKDAWLLERMHELKPIAHGLAGVDVRYERSTGGVRCVCEGSIGASRVRQVVTLLNGLPLIHIDLDLDWRERQCVLRGVADAAIVSDTATYASQVAVVTRPTHRDLLADAARFEVPAQGWVDLSESGEGLTLMARDRYGFSCHGSQMGVTLMRSPIAPDPRGETGRYAVSLALCPHSGTWQEARTPWVYGNFARPPLPIASGFVKDRARVRVVEADGSASTRFLTQCFKWAEDADGLILRGCDTIGARGTVWIEVDGGRLKAAQLSDLNEAGFGELPIDERGRVEIALMPFELVTVRLSLHEGVAS
ncbi:MAG: glycoside hydrolase family 38 C-terminal domain-containing protein [Planctomycetota bacterium]